MMENDYPLWEQHLEEDIQGIFDRKLGIDDDYYLHLDNIDYDQDM